MWLVGLLGENSVYNQIDIPGWEVPKTVWETVLASVILDYILAGSEIFHRLKLHQSRNNPNTQQTCEEGQMLKNGPHLSQQQYTAGQHNL